MKAKDYIRAKIKKINSENVYDLQFALLLHLEENVVLPKWLETKIENLMDRYGFKRKAEIIAQAITSSVAATALAKDAQRQASGEYLQFEYLQKERGINIKKLKTNGFGSVRILNGELIHDSSRAINGATKTIDAICDTDYIAMKYVNAAGGAQDNQILDIKNFIEAAKVYSEINDDDVTFSVIVDGDYIESKIPELKKLANSCVRVCTSDTYVPPNEYKILTNAN